jgi:glutamate--cysteine ligase
MSIPQQGGGPIESREDLTSYLSTGCKPPEAWRIGTEHEKFGYRLSDHSPLPYEGACSIRAMLEGLRDRFDWAPVIEAGNIIGLEKNGANVSLEPGGQLELSGAPLETIHQTCDEVNTHLAEVREVADAIGAGFIGLGAAPIWRHEDMDVMPKGRYGIMKRYMQTVGTRGLHMMFRTCTVQVNLDFSSEADMVKKLRVALALQPVATALFANSPFWQGKPAGRLSYRAYCWQDLDADRTGMLPFVFEDGFGFERYVDYALDVPMYFVYRDGKYIDVAGQSFRDFLKGELPGLPGELPTQSDWGDHLTTIFPEARIKKFIEMRGADGGPWRSLCALPALWVGLTYDQTALDAAWDLAKGWSQAEREQLRLDAGQFGLKARIGGHSLQEIAQEVLRIAEAGLKARGRAAGFDHDESHFLNAVQQIAASGRTAAEDLLDRYNGEWGGDLDRVYGEFSY